MENKYNIAGIQQIGIGVENFAEAWKYYIDVFNMDIRILEDDKVAELMLPYTGGLPQKRRAAIALNMQGGGGFEIWQYAERKPQPISFEIQVGDLGVFAAKIKSRDVVKTYELFSRKKNIHILGRLTDGIDGHATFFMKDIFGNIFQIIHEPSVYRDEKRLTGGIAGAMIGVTDIDKAMPIYRDILGYDVIVIYGNPYNYVSRGFKSCKKYNICHENGTCPSAMMVKELKKGVLDGRKWFYYESPVMNINEQEAERFDESLEKMEKEIIPSQEEFYIYSHSMIQ